MTDLTAAQVNTFAAADPAIGAAIIVDQGGVPMINLNALTGETYDAADLSSISMAETMLKLCKCMSQAASSIYEANPAIDARNSYPEMTAQIFTDTDGNQYNRYTCQVRAQSPLDFDSVVAI